LAPIIASFIIAVVLLSDQQSIPGGLRSHERAHMF
jgi:hypothetical protein